MWAPLVGRGNALVASVDFRVTRTVSGPGAGLSNGVDGITVGKRRTSNSCLGPPHVPERYQLAYAAMPLWGRIRA